MKNALSTFGFALLFSIATYTSSAQCIVDAGNDTVVCTHHYISLSHMLGGNPTAKGGVEPYKYVWSCNAKQLGKHTYTASFFLDDTTIANPRIKNVGWDTLIFNLSVIDSLGNSCEGRFKLIFCSFVIGSIDKRAFIKKGDTLELNHTVYMDCGFNKFEWTPDYNISDKYSSNPKVWPDTSVRYNLIITDNQGCTAEDYYKVFVNATSVSKYTASGFRISIFPNPMTDRATVKVENANGNKVSLMFYDVVGRLVYEANVIETLELDASQFSKGIYLFKAMDNGKFLTSGKFVVN